MVPQWSDLSDLTALLVFVFRNYSRLKQRVCQSFNEAERNHCDGSKIKVSYGR